MQQEAHHLNGLSNNHRRTQFAPTRRSSKCAWNLLRDIPYAPPKTGGYGIRPYERYLRDARWGCRGGYEPPGGRKWVFTLGYGEYAMGPVPLISQKSDRFLTASPQGEAFAGASPHNDGEKTAPRFGRTGALFTGRRGRRPYIMHLGRR